MAPPASPAALAWCAAAHGAAAAAGASTQRRCHRCSSRFLATPLPLGWIDQGAATLNEFQRPGNLPQPFRGLALASLARLAFPARRRLRPCSPFAPSARITACIPPHTHIRFHSATSDGFSTYERCKMSRPQLLRCDGVGGCWRCLWQLIQGSSALVVREAKGHAAAAAAALVATNSTASIPRACASGAINHSGTDR